MISLVVYVCFYVLNETINQACANKYIETIFTKEILDKIYVMEEERMQYPYIFQITNFLDDYLNNRDSYNTFVDFKSNLEKYLSELK